ASSTTMRPYTTLFRAENGGPPGTTSTPASGASPSPTGSAEQPKTGGTLRRRAPNLPPTLDPYATQDTANKGLVNQVYSNLWQIRSEETRLNSSHVNSS